MQKLTSLILTALLVFSLISSFAADRVEISFAIGDSTLLINGKEVNVETPYIAGEGTTLVPLRVITEAFGAAVSWDGETKTITLNFPRKTIILVIDNNTAKVNGQEMLLPVAPTLSASGVTMVPLRFISETFGAEVGYKDGYITVTYPPVDPNEPITIENDYWLMKASAKWNPEGDDRNAHFVNKELDVEIKVSTMDDNFTLTSERKNYVKGIYEKELAEGATVVKAMTDTKLNGYNGYIYAVKHENGYVSLVYCLCEKNCIVTMEYIYNESKHTPESEKESRTVIHSYKMK
ncbi:MAG: copper amine oxidase N-terminal domain-containing protein [Clostridia bacterium]|nr:copper amine oxidase N-terminal domain-containing protein [Clostridia bacterium]